ncbi:MAG: hypothetical protein AAFW87_07805 [Pseudomonadota bacterium]
MARPSRHILPAILVGATLVSACSRDDETSMRARLAAWFALDETLAFSAEQGCAAGAFRLVHDQIGAGVPVETNVSGMLRALPARGVAAVDDPDLSPDKVMIEAANEQRSIGMSMRRAALEARTCMRGPIGAEFLRMLVNPATVFAYETTEGAVMLVDRENRVLLVAIGART